MVHQKCQQIKTFPPEMYLTLVINLFLVSMTLEIIYPLVSFAKSCVSALVGSIAQEAVYRPSSSDTSHA
jgi:hypothetical protein